MKRLAVWIIILNFVTEYRSIDVLIYFRTYVLSYVCTLISRYVSTYV